VTGVYYLDDQRREQFGVTMATTWAEGQEIRIDGKPYHGYTANQLRPVTDYLEGARFAGVMVLRPAVRSS
jgi:hypothetical protein